MRMSFRQSFITRTFTAPVGIGFAVIGSFLGLVALKMFIGAVTPVAVLAIGLTAVGCLAVALLSAYSEWKFPQSLASSPTLVGTDAPGVTNSPSGAKLGAGVMTNNKVVASKGAPADQEQDVTPAPDAETADTHCALGAPK